LFVACGGVGVVLALPALSAVPNQPQASALNLATVAPPQATPILPTIVTEPPTAVPTRPPAVSVPTPLSTPRETPKAASTAVVVPTEIVQSPQPPTPQPVGPTSRPALSKTAVAAPTGEDDSWFSIGTSVEGRQIRAIKFGTGPTHLAIVGAIHGGWEKNTMTLVQKAYEYFRDNRDEIPDELTVYFVPAINPDGVAAGTDRESAWNAHGVDLNRNFASYNWSRDTFGRVGGRYGPTGTRKNGGGPTPFSEPETKAVRDFILGDAINVVLSYHSGIVSVTAKDGGGGIGEPLAKQVAAITGYGYIAKWTEYKLTGQFMDWLDEQQVKGVEIELPDQQTLDWSKNLKAMQAVMRSMAEN
jgi:hypothetical protein